LNRDRTTEHINRTPYPLFAADNSLMLFGDGKQAVIDIAAALVTV
jgi:NAD/NADP transhydrogenase beta subunit